MKSILPELLAAGRIARPWLGIQGHLVPSALKELLRIPLTDGLLVEVVEPGSPAARVGIRGGHLDVVIGGRAFLLGAEIITRVNGQPVETPDGLVQAMGSLRVGDTVCLTLFRGGKTQEVEFLLPERPILPQDLLAQGALVPWRFNSAFWLGAKAGHHFPGT